MMDLDISDDQFKRLSNAQKLDVLYVNQKRMLNLYDSQLALVASIKRKQNIQWWSLGVITSGITWLFIEMWRHVTK